MLKFRLTFLLLIPVILVMVIPHFSLSGASPATFDERARHYLEILPHDAPGGFGAVARMATGRPVGLEHMARDLNHVNTRRDCADFVMAGFIRLLYLYGDDPALSADVREQVTEAVLNFKYWIDEPGRDSMCYWSENHQVLFHSAEYLAGALFPDRVFTNSGMTGREHVAKGRRLLEQWMGWRERFGFSEWFSNVYYEEDLYPLFNLVDFSPDPVIATRAAMAVDQLALNLSLNSFYGQVRATHGRTYEDDMLTSSGDDVSQAMYLLWGVREFTPDLAELSKAGVAISTSTYRLPAAIECIGADHPPEVENYQTHGIAIEDAPLHGISHDDLDSGMFFWGMGMYTHPLVGDLTLRMWKEWDLQSNAFFLGAPALIDALVPEGGFGRLLSRVDIASQGAYLDDAHTYTYRTPSYQLASVLDRRPGQIAAQSMAWSALLGPDAFVFTTCPGKIIVGGSPGRWTGNGSNPRVGQYKNVLVAVYNAPARVTLGEVKRYSYTHAWFPRDAFDEVLTQDNWVFGRKGDGCVALYSHKPLRFIESGPYADNEIRARGRQNIWVCEMGSAREYGGFESFVDSVSRSSIEIDGLSVRYDSPSRGPVEFGWSGPLRVGGGEVPLRREMRYDNPYVRAERGSRKLEVRCKSDSLVLDFENHERTMSEGR